MTRRAPTTPAPAPPADPRELSPEDLVRDGTLTVAQAVEFSGISEAEVKRDIRTGLIPSFKRKRIRLIPKRGLVLYLARLCLDGRREEGVLP